MYIPPSTDATVSIPSGWFSSGSDVMAMLTGVGYVAGSSTAPCKPTIIARGTTYLDVRISDDATANDGSFDFMLFNRNDWYV